jgi:selenium metabolism protein YedF
MAEIIDVRGLTCPQPVILTKKALEEHTEIVVIVDDPVALENVKRLAENQGHAVEVEQEGSSFHIRLSKGSACSFAERAISSQGLVVMVIASDTMGRGEDVLGTVLMKSLLHTLMETTPMPDVMIFFNTGVKLAAQGSEVLEDLDALSKAGVRILICGTCLNYFGLKDKLQAGAVSNMYDIAQTMFSAGRLVQI